MWPPMGCRQSSFEIPLLFGLSDATDTICSARLDGRPIRHSLVRNRTRPAEAGTERRTAATIRRPMQSRSRTDASVQSIVRRFRLCHSVGARAIVQRPGLWIKHEPILRPAVRTATSWPGIALRLQKQSTPKDPISGRRLFLGACRAMRHLHGSPLGTFQKGPPAGIRTFHGGQIGGLSGLWNVYPRGACEV